MRLLIDTNILLDVLEDRKPYCESSSLVWKLAETGQAECFITALSVANIIYVMRKELDPGRTSEILNGLRLIFGMTGLEPQHLLDAAGLGWDDFEDAVQSVTASEIKADFLITRNTKDFRLSRVPAVTPSEYLERICSW